MRNPIVLVAVCTFLIVGRSSAAAQESDGPYITGSGGGLFGDGRTTGSFALGFGYMTPRRVGLEVELAYAPSILEAPDLQILAPPPVFGGIEIFPPPEFSIESRLLTLQTNVVGLLPWGSSRRLRATVEAGGGIAAVHRRLHITQSTPVFPALPDFGSDPFAQLTFTTIERDVSSSQSALVLGAGAGFDYALNARVALGTRVRYQHLFTSGDALDQARVEARLRWAF